MENQRKEYTFFWFIENLSYCWHKPGEELASPPFTADWLKGTVWNLQLYPRGRSNVRTNDDFSIFLNRSEDDDDDGPDSISIESELSALSADGSPLFSWNQTASFKRGDRSGWLEILKMSEILSQRKEDYLPQDILTLRCKIRKGKGNVHNTGQCSARTRVKVEKISFLHVVDDFASLQREQTKIVQIRSHPKEERFITSSLHVTPCSSEEKWMIKIVPSDERQILLKCTISVLDVKGDATVCRRADSRYDPGGKHIDKLYLPLRKSAILEKKRKYLSDNKLSLLCECTFSSGLEFQTIEETVYKTPLPAFKQSYGAPKKNARKAEGKLSAYPSALEDLKALYLNQSLTDVRLKTKTRTFPAHKSVLCARSPVFNRMMDNDMKEKNTECIQVDDVGDGVMEKLLLFLYSDTVDSLEWQTATELYYAADKYQVGKLKALCSSFLVESLTPTNAGDLLLLADTHSDFDVKKTVEDFILEHEREVFVSKEWEKLMEVKPMLAMKTMQLKYLR